MIVEMTVFPVLAAANAPAPSPGTLSALLLLSAVIGGVVARFLHVPRVIGYLLAGFALKYVLAFLLQGPGGYSDTVHRVAASVEPLGLIKQLALGLILFSIGSVFEFTRLRPVRRFLLRLACAETVVVTMLVGIGCSLICGQVLSANATSAVVFGVLLAATAVATAPGATLLVLEECDAKGLTTDTLLTLTGTNNLISIVLFHAAFLVFAATGVISAPGPGRALVWLDLVLTSVGSVGLGIVLGYVLGWAYAKVSLTESLLIFFGFVFALAAGAGWLASRGYPAFNFLVTCLSLGAVFANIAIDADRLPTALKPVSDPIYALFFTLAGFELHVEELWHLPALCLGYVVLRSTGKILGARVGRRWVGRDPELHPFLGMGMLCQAGVAIGLATFLTQRWGTLTDGVFTPHPLADTFQAVILGTVAAFELIGPILTRSVVIRAGEVKAIALIRRNRAAVAPGRSVARLLFGSLLQTVGLGRPALSAGAGRIQVRHIMRTNVRFLAPDAPLREVLRFVERSRFNHFPVVDADSQLRGVIHFSDIRDIIYDPVMRNLITAMDLSDPQAPAVAVDDSLDHLLTVFRETNYGSLPVVDGEGSRRVVGVVEQRDLFQALDRAAEASDTR